jgi:hypothetical protein
MSAQEQKRKQERMASKGFIRIISASAAAGFTTYDDGLFSITDATPVPFFGQNPELSLGRRE